ncbi:MAG: acyl-CoA carboxylase subunit beta [Acidimicrobiales bacterium]
MRISAGRSAAATAEMVERPELGDGRRIGLFRLEGGLHAGAIGPAEGEIVERLVRTATGAGVPVVGVVATSGADIAHGVASLHAWGKVARALADASGVVPTAVVVGGACLSGPALLLGMVDVVVMARSAFAYVSGPDAVRRFTGAEVGHVELGGALVHQTRTGLAWALAADEDEALHLALDVLSYLPPNNAEEPPFHGTGDPVDRDCAVAAAAVPSQANSSYDVRTVVADVVDAGSWVEAWAGHAANVVCGLATVAGHPVGVVANQPAALAGALDIDGSVKAARLVQLCDSFNVALVTFVDTPGFQSGKDIQWRGMIRHGAELVHAYGAATVPRVSVVLRKAYGGAYIVMDSQGLGSDVCLAWPSAEVAVMGAAGAISVLHRKRSLPDAERRALEDDYAARYCTPDQAAERGFVDQVIRPVDTRRAVATALDALRTKREHLPRRHHANTPL